MKNSRPTFGNGKICYIEIPTEDSAKSAAFYQQVFNWSIRTGDDGSISFDDGVGEVSGAWISGRKAASEPGIMVSIMVDQLHTTIDLIQRHGGTVTKQEELEGGQKVALFNDPFGNLFSIYQP